TVAVATPLPSVPTAGENDNAPCGMPATGIGTGGSRVGWPPPRPGISPTCESWTWLNAIGWPYVAAYKVTLPLLFASMRRLIGSQPTNRPLVLSRIATNGTAVGLLRTTMARGLGWLFSWPGVSAKAAMPLFFNSQSGSRYGMTPIGWNAPMPTGA